MRCFARLRCMELQAIGYEQDLGSIEPGKLADILVLNKDPLENIRNTNTIRLDYEGRRCYVGGRYIEPSVAGREKAC